jgi:hypothetical protein
MAKQDEPKCGRGRPPKTVPGIPDTFENVVAALVQPVSKSEKAKRSE